MPLLHRYYQKDFQNGFETHNTILDIVPYKPEVIFIGTYNHGWAWNHSDFFYGRGMYMWPVMGNLFLNNQNFFYRHYRQITIQHQGKSFAVTAFLQVYNLSVLYVFPVCHLYACIFQMALTMLLLQKHLSPVEAIVV